MSKKFTAIDETRELTIVNAHIASFEESAKGRLWRDSNRVMWSIGHGNAIVRIDRVNAAVVKKFDAAGTVADVFNVTIDTMARVDGHEQRIIRRVGMVGFSPKSDAGTQAPYLLTGSGKLATKSPNGENQAILSDVVGFVIKAHKKAAINDSVTFWNEPIVRNSVKSHVVGSAITL